MTKDWESVQQKIKELSVDQNQKLEDVKKIMEEKHRFRASTRAYRMKLKEWGYMKHRPRRASPSSVSGQHRERSRTVEAADGDAASPAGAHADRDVSMEEQDSPHPHHILAGDADLLPTLDPWCRAESETTNSLMDMLSAILEGDSQRLEQLIIANPGHINMPIGLPFEAPDGRFLNHPAMQRCVILQHPDQTLLDVACAQPAGPVVWVLLRLGAIGSKHPLGTDLAFHNAIKNGRTYNVRSLICTGLSNVEGVPGTTWKPLHQAAFWNVPDIVQILLDQGASVNDAAPSPDGTDCKTPLQLVLDRRVKEYTNPPVKERCELILKMLLDASANIHIPASDHPNGYSPFETFIKPWQINAAWAMKLSAIEVDCLTAFLQQKPNLQTPMYAFPCTATSGATFEHQVLWHSTPHIARFLVDNVAGCTDSSGLLHEVVGSCPNAKRHPADTLRDIAVLFKRGAYPNLIAGDNSTPLTKCLRHCPAVDVLARVQALLDGGANPELKDGSGAEPVVMVAKSFEGTLRMQLLESLMLKFPAKSTNGAYCWDNRFLPIEEEPTLQFLSLFTKKDSDFRANARQMLPSDVVDIFSNATWSAVSKRFLDGVMKRARLARALELPMVRTEEIGLVVKIREAFGSPEYSFGQDFALNLLLPPKNTSTRSPDPVAVIEGTIESPTRSSHTTTTAPELSGAFVTELAILPDTLPTPIYIETPQASTSEHRLSVSSVSSQGSINGIVPETAFVPDTTIIRIPASTATRKTRPKDREDFKKRYGDPSTHRLCEDCGDGVRYTQQDFRKHEAEHTHALNCNEEQCRRRFCAAQ